MAASLAYYALFSTVPLLVIALGITELVQGKRAEEGELSHSLEFFMGARPAKAIEELLNDMHPYSTNGLFAGVGFAVFLFGAIWVFVELQNSLNIIWKVPSPRRVGWIVRMRGRLLLFVLVLITGFLLLTMVASSVTLTALSRYLESSRFTAWLLHGVNVCFSIFLVTCLFALNYRLLPEPHVPRRHAWAGAFCSSFLYCLGNYALGLYLTYSPPNTVFGAASGVTVILLWVYYSSLIFFLGAEYVYSCGEEQVAVKEEGVTALWHYRK
jgi:membrane protein